MRHYSKYPPAKPGALCCEPLKAAVQDVKMSQTVIPAHAGIQEGTRRPLRASLDPRVRGGDGSGGGDKSDGEVDRR